VKTVMVMVVTVDLLQSVNVLKTVVWAWPVVFVLTAALV